MTPPPGWSWVRALGLLVASAVLFVGLLGGWRGVQFYLSMQESGAEYDASYDPIVVENGVLRVEGPRVPRSDEGKLIVDPDDALDLDALAGEGMIVFRSHEVVRVRSFERRLYAYDPMLQALGMSSLRIDGATLTEGARTWGPLLAAVTFGLIVGFGVPAQLFGCTLLAVLGAAPIALLWRPPGGPTGMAVVRTALGVSAVLPPIWALASLAGHSTACCFDLCVFPPFITIGTLAALKLQRR